MRARFWRQAELGEFIDIASGAVADPDHRFRDVDGRNVDHALAALADQIKTVVAGRDEAGDEGRRKFHHHVPAHGHDVGFVLVRGTDEYDRAGLEQAADVVDGEVVLLVAGHLNLMLSRVPDAVQRDSCAPQSRDPHVDPGSAAHRCTLRGIRGTATERGMRESYASAMPDAHSANA